jgi:hypothetical protein
MKALGDYIHSKGLYYGVYSDCGVKTCAGRPGSEHYEVNDANSYASCMCWCCAAAATPLLPPSYFRLWRFVRRGCGLPEVSLIALQQLLLPHL